MTAADMNGSERKKSRVDQIAVASLVLVVSIGAAGCVGSFDPATDPTSPLAPRVDALVEANRTYPRWENFPRSSEDAPTPAQFAERVGSLNVAATGLGREVAAISWTLDDPEAFAAATAARVDASLASPITQVTRDRIDAFARELRERGQAPPPVPRY